MATPSQSMFTEAVAAARAGDRVRARELFARLLRGDSANAEYWVWMSSVVDTDRERIYSLESALKLDPTNRAALRGLAILGARKPHEAELAAALRIPRRQVAAIATGPAIGRLRRFNWSLLAASVIGVAIVGTLTIIGGPLLSIITSLLRPHGLGPPPSLVPLTASGTLTSIAPTSTLTPLPASTRVLRTPIPTEFARTPLAFFVPVTPTPTPVLGTTPHSQYPDYEAAISALTSGDFKLCLSLIGRVIDNNPGFPDAFYIRGEALRLMGRPGDASQAYDQAVLIDPGFAPAFLGRGRALLEINADTAMADFDRAVAADPRLADAYIEKAQVFASRRQWSNAVQVLQAAIDAGARSPLAYIRLGQAQLNQGDYVTALNNAIEGSASDPTLLEGYFVIGATYVELDHFSDALWPLTTYVEYAPKDYSGWTYLGRAQTGAGDVEAAGPSIDRALDLNDRYAPAYLARGYYDLARGDPKSALDDFKRARRYGPENYDLSYGLGKASFQAGLLTDAINYLNNALAFTNDEKVVSEKEHKRAEAYAALGLVYESTKPPLLDDAIASWSWILNLNNASPDTRALAVEHLQRLTGKVPTLPATLTPSRTPTATLTPTPTPTTSGTPGPTLTSTPGVPLTSSPTPTPTPTGTAAGTFTPGPSPTATSTPTPGGPTTAPPTPTPTRTPRGYG